MDKMGRIFIGDKNLIKNLLFIFPDRLEETVSRSVALRAGDLSHSQNQCHWLEF
jgi:hypothetical protein